MSIDRTGEEHASLAGERGRGRGGVRSLPRAARLSLLALLSLRLSVLRLPVLSSTLCSDRLLHMH